MSADQAKAKPAVAEKPAGGKTAAAEKPVTGKKAQPTNCTQCNVRIRRKSWYYRDGKHFCGPNCAKLYREKQAAEKEKAAGEAEAKAKDHPAAAGEETTPKAA